MIKYNTKRYWGYSNEIKPKYAQIGDRYLELDTKIEYVFGEYNQWHSINSSGNSVSGDFLPLSGGTVTGGTIFQSGLTSTTKTTIGSEGDISCALLQMASTTQGVLFPRMTNAQRQSISSPIPGLFVYCTDDDGGNNREGLFMYKSTGWLQIL